MTIGKVADMQRFLVLVGVVCVAGGLLWSWLARFPFGRLPGDITIERGNFSFYFPIATSIIVSLLLSVIFWLWRK